MPISEVCSPEDDPFFDLLFMSCYLHHRHHHHRPRVKLSASLVKKVKNLAVVIHSLQGVNTTIRLKI